MQSGASTGEPQDKGIPEHKMAVRVVRATRISTLSLSPSHPPAREWPPVWEDVHLTGFSASDLGYFPTPPTDSLVVLLLVNRVQPPCKLLVARTPRRTRARLVHRSCQLLESHNPTITATPLNLTPIFAQPQHRECKPMSSASCTDLDSSESPNLYAPTPSPNPGTTPIQNVSQCYVRLPQPQARIPTPRSRSQSFHDPHTECEPGSSANCTDLASCLSPGP